MVLVEFTLWSAGRGMETNESQPEPAGPSAAPVGDVVEETRTSAPALSIPGAPSSSNGDPRGTAGVLRVLLAEDEQFQRDAFEALFAAANRRLGGKLLFSVKLVSCADEVMAAIQETTDWQLVLLDINMPGTSGTPGPGGSEIISDVRHLCDLELYLPETAQDPTTAPAPAPISVPSLDPASWHGAPPAPPLPPLTWSHTVRAMRNPRHTLLPRTRTLPNFLPQLHPHCADQHRAQEERIPPCALPCPLTLTPRTHA